MQIKRALRKFRIMPSTKAFIHEARFNPGQGITDTLHGYIYGRWPYLCIGLGTGEHRLPRLMKPLWNSIIRILLRFPSDNPQFDAGGLKPGKRQGLSFFREETFADTYHAKVIHLESAKKIVSVNQEVQLTNLEHVIPYSLARDIVIRKPNRILLLECPCRVSRSNPCLPLDVCFVMGDPFVSFVAEHHPEKSRLIDRDEAIDVLTAEAERGHVHHAFFKEALFGRFFAICNCCACCCAAMQAQRNGIPMLASSGYVSVIDNDECSGCEICAKSCQFNAITMNDKLAVVNPETCMGCGVCTGICPENALSLVRDHTRSDPLELDQLLEEPFQR